MENYRDLLAHYDIEDPRKKQFLVDHLFDVSRITKRIGSTVGLSNISELIGLLHDLGKYKYEFQLYIKGKYRGNVNHTSAGAGLLEHIETIVKSRSSAEVNINHKVSMIYKEVLQYPILSHHGLYDIIDKNHNYRTKIRLEYNNDTAEMKKALEFFEFLNSEYIKANNKSIYDLYFEGLMEFEHIYLKLKDMARRFNEETDRLNEKIKRKKALHFYYGALIRLLLSILKEADIYDSSNYYRTDRDKIYSVDDINIIWNQMGESVEALYAKFEDKKKSELDIVRTELANELYEHSIIRKNGAYKLDMPVGAGKTFAALRYAIGNCNKFNKSRILYCTAYLSVLEQNASEIKGVLGEEHVLEHHSNIIDDREEEIDESDQNDYKEYEYLKESWESPVILTTLVQLSNTMFKDKASNIRRFSKLINSVIIIDEIQSLPNKAIFNFNLMTNFLVNIMNCNIVHSTATPPNLDNKEALKYPCFYEDGLRESTIDNGGIETKNLSIFHRVDYYSLLGKELDEEFETKDIVNHIKSQVFNEKSTLVVLNTKRAVSNIYNELIIDSELLDSDCEVIYLTTNQCAKHRLEIIEYMKERLKDLRNFKSDRKLICVSTKLVEAGVDIDFDLVYRSLAGIDSIIQCGGRCNREGKKPIKGKLFIIKYKDENLTYLKEIQKQRTASESALKLLRISEENDEPIDIEQACDYYFHKLFSNEEIGGRSLEFPIKEDDTIFDLLTTNPKGLENYRNEHNKDAEFIIKHGFKTAGKEFDLIKENTLSVIVQYKNEQLINEFYEAIENNRFYDIKSILKRLQPYTINIRKNNEYENYLIKELDGEVFILRKDAYNKEVGIIKSELQSLVF